MPERAFLVRTVLTLFAAAMLLVGMATQTARANASPLPADQAFSPSVTQSGPHMLVVSWHIADGYYLYWHALKFRLAHGGSARLGTPQIPPGNRSRDAYFGAVETYRQRLQVTVPIIGSPPPGARLVVDYQGCADAGLCYPPQHETLGLPTTASTTSPTGAAHERVSNAPDEESSAAIATGLGRTSLWYTSGLFFLLGLGLAFTPCILPMIPIVAGMLGTDDYSRGRAVALSGAYVVAMAMAYGLFGLVAGYFGTNLQALLQRPIVLLPFAAVFLVLAAASFGWFSLQIPTRLQSRLATAGRGHHGLVGAAALGFLAALIAGPCLAPPLAGALLYISLSGDVLTGACALFALGLGIGAPLIALAVFGVGVLPRNGPWMSEVRIFFGVLLAAVGLWLALRLAAETLALAAWGALALVYGAYLSTRATISVPATVIKRVIVTLLLGYAALAAAGLSIGNGRSVAPLAGLAAGNNRVGPPAGRARSFKRVTTPAGLSHALAAARRAKQPAVVDFYADWCVDCVHMKHTVFTNPRVRHTLSGMTAIEFDVTAYDRGQQRLMQRLHVFGPPTLLFYSGSATTEVPRHRLVGAVDVATLLHALDQVGAHGAS